MIRVNITTAPKQCRVIFADAECTVGVLDGLDVVGAREVVGTPEGLDVGAREVVGALEGLDVVGHKGW